MLYHFPNSDSNFTVMFFPPFSDIYPMQVFFSPKEEKDALMTCLIQRNTTVPTRKSKVFTVASPGRAQGMALMADWEQVLVINSG